MSVVYTRTARADLREVARYYAKVNPDFGRRIIQQIRQRCRQLGRFPKMGRTRDELAEGLRSFPTRPYVVFYKPTTRGVMIVRVIHGSRDIGPAMFGS